jgi:hypothetical protein
MLAMTSTYGVRARRAVFVIAAPGDVRGNALDPAFRSTKGRLRNTGESEDFRCSFSLDLLLDLAQIK